MKESEIGTTPKDDEIYLMFAELAEFVIQLQDRVELLDQQVSNLTQP
jgi:hypothetical protein